MTANLTIIAFAGVAAAALAIALTSLFFELQASSAEKRLKALLVEQPASMRQSCVREETCADWIEQWGESLGSWAAKAHQFLVYYEQAFLPVSFPHFLLIGAALIVICGGGLFVASGDVRLIPLGVVVGTALPWTWMVWSRKSRLRRFSVQFPDALDLLSRAMRSGQSLIAGMRAISDEMLPPVTEEFQRVSEAISLGTPTEVALESMLDRVPSDELRFFVTAVQINAKSGGNLSEVLNKISACMRERFRIEGQLQALTGEGRISGTVLLALPVAIFLAIFTLNPDYVIPLFDDPVGKQLLGVSIVLQMIGALVIQKMVKVDV